MRLPWFFLLLLFFLKSFVGVSQGYNHAWLIGYASSNNVARINFDSNNVTIIPEVRKMKFRATQGTISDAHGNLLISSNGCFLANALGDTMMNGSGLNPGLFANDWCTNSSGMPFSHANLIVPFPGDSNKYVLFHQTGNYNLINSVATELYYTIIDMTLDGGLGAVTFKNQIALQDTLSQGIAACKHANGRDWWIVVTKDNSDIIYKLLLTPNGISSITMQPMLLSIARFVSGQPSFSPDGSMFAYTTLKGLPSVHHDIRLFNFDRCTGEFSDSHKINISDTHPGIGLTFSSNSEYLYACSTYHIFQINTASYSVDTIAINDGYYSPSPPFQTDFWLMYLAANGKIYISSGNGVLDLHFINYPDSVGLSCDVHQHGFHLPCFSARGNVNHPNYYLGPVNGSICDSLGLSVSENNFDFHFSIFPNPVTDGRFSISYLMPQNKNGKLELFDINGKRVYAQTLPQWSTLQQIHLPPLASGIYECIIKSGNQLAVKKFGVVNEE